MNEKKFSFEVIDARTTPDFAASTFEVVQLKGYDAISRPYIFEILLISTRSDINLSDAVHLPARLTLHNETDPTKDIWYNGVLSQIEQLHQFNQYTFYRALLVPRLWRLTLNKQFKVYLNKTATQIIGAALGASSLGTTDYDLTTGIVLEDEEDISTDDSDIKPPQKYPVYDYVCQYGESYLDFISRWAEREGIFYYFTQGTQALKVDKVMFANKITSLPFLPLDSTLTYSMTSAETIKSFTARQKMLPASVMMKNYNYSMPVYSVNDAGNNYELSEIKPFTISNSTDVDTNAHGEVYLYGENIQTANEGARLTAIRKEEITCREEQYFGESDIYFLKPGYKFKLASHYRSDFNWNTTNNKIFLIEEVTHEGSQTGYLINGLGFNLSGMEEKNYYENRFTSLSAHVEYRPERKTKKPRVTGTINANIDAAGGGGYAELDSQGRYKVRLPFDKYYDNIAISAADLAQLQTLDPARYNAIVEQKAALPHKPGNASAYLRMMQPHAGEPVTNGKNYGVHFPLRKGTEVLLSFIDGDPDRPVIAGAVPNPLSKSPVTGGDNTVDPVIPSNQKKSIFRDRSGNEIIFDSTVGSEYISIHSPHGDGSGVIYGAGEPDEDDTFEYDSKGGSSAEFGAGNKFEAYAGNTLELGSGLRLEGFVGNSLEAKLAAAAEIFLGLSFEFALAGKAGVSIGTSAEVNIGPKYEFTKGPSKEIGDDDIDSIADGHNIISSKKAVNLIAGTASVTPSTTDKASVLYADNKALSISFGKNVTPGGAPVVQNLTGWKWGIAVAAVISVIVGLISTILVGVAGLFKKGEGWKIALGVLGTIAGIIEGILNIVIVFFIWKVMHASFDELIQPVSHTDADGEKPDSLIRLEDKRILIAVEPVTKNIGGNFKIDPKSPKSQIEMHEDGFIFINSKAAPDKRKIILGVGERDTETAMITVKDKGVELKCDKSRIWINPDNGNIHLTTSQASSGNICLFGKDQIQLNTQDTMFLIAKKKIDIKSDVKVNINKMSVDDNQVQVKTKFNHKYLTVG